MAGIVDGQGYGVGLAPENQIRIPWSYDIYDQDGNNIGFLTSFNPSSDRPVDGVRHLNSSDAGRIVEAVPKVSNDTISVNGFAIYNSAVTKRGTLLNRLGGSVDEAIVHINQNKIPFTIVATCNHPGDASLTEDMHETKYIDCLLTNYSQPVSVNDTTISESASIFVSRVE